jgi:hypothetical protein
MAGDWGNWWLDGKQIRCAMYCHSSKWQGRTFPWSNVKIEGFSQPLNRHLKTQILRKQSVRKFQNPIKSFIQVSRVVQIWIEILPLSVREILVLGETEYICVIQL